MLGSVREAAVRPKVYSVAVELTAFCNQKCDYCYNEWREDGGQNMSTGDRKTLVARVSRLVAALDVDHVTLTGGEPFAHPGVFDVLDVLREHRVPAFFISNGGIVTDAIARRLAPYAPLGVQITLNGPDAALHEAHVGPGHFENTLRGIGALRLAGVNVVGCIVVTKKNAARVGEIIELWRALGVTSIALSRFSPAGYAARHAAQLLPSRKDLVTAFEQADPYGRDGMVLTCTMPVPPCAVETERFAGIRFGVCPIGTSMQEFALGPDGKLRNCTLHASAIGGVEDVLDPRVDLAELIRHADVTEYRRKTPDFCKGCSHEQTCAGGCGAAAEWVLGDARAFPDPLVWQYVSADFAKSLVVARRNGRTHLETVM
jgi:radical SAM protein with 4Fe4S-binding SPASM domain